MMISPDITIIGGGAIGLLTAKEFIQAGATVTILEKKQVGQESSWAGGGILLPLYPWRQAEAISQLVLQSLKLYPALAGQLAESTGIDPELHTCGMLITQNPDYQAAIRWCNQYAIPFRQADSLQLAALNIRTEHPFWMPSIGQIRNPRLLKALKQDLLDKGATLHEHCQIGTPTTAHGKITHLNTSHGTIKTHQIVIAAGAWSQQLLGQLFPQWAQNTPQIKPVRGQMLLYQAEPDTLPHIILDGGHYLIPRLDGKIVVGSTVENQGFDKSTTQAALTQLHEFATRLLPALANYPLIKHWAGLRPGTRDGIPYIGRHPLLDNLYMNAGHFRNGLVMGPASAQLLVDLVLNRPPQVTPTPYSFDNANNLPLTP